MYVPGQQIAPHHWREGWASGWVSYSGVTIVLPPNSPSCAHVHDWDWGIWSVGSHHAGGAHILMCDGAVRFASELIDTGNLTSPDPGTGTSPYGIWGALGTMNGNDSGLIYSTGRGLHALDTQ